MSERYTRLFALTGNLYSESSPVVISAGILSKDNQTGKVIAQLKIKNIGNKAIKAARVELALFDTVGQSIGEKVHFEYLDLNIRRDEEFGQKTPILIPEATSRSFDVKIKEIIFFDNSVWSGADASWSPLCQQERLESIIADKELLKQYRIKYGSDAVYESTKDRDVWHCACGALNRQNEDVCHKCEKSFLELNNVNFALLETERDIRLKNEADRRAELQAIELENKQKNIVKIKKMMPFAIVLLVVAVIASVFLKKNMDYNNAIALIEAKQYESAYAAFESLGNFKDSQEYLACFELVPIEKRGPYSYTTLEYDEYGRLIRENTTGYTDDLFDKERKFIYNDTDASLTVVYKYTSVRTNGKNNVVTETTTFNSDRSEAKFVREGNFPTKYFNRYYTYDSNGYVLTAESINCETNEIEYRREYFYEYQNDKLISSYYRDDSILGDWNYTEYEYDADGLLSAINSHVMNEYIYGYIYIPKK